MRLHEKTMPILYKKLMHFEGNFEIINMYSHFIGISNESARRMSS